jgi:DNA-binding SARP family transcriptional activator
LPGSTIIECAPNELRLPQYRIVCSPQALDEERAEKIAELLRTASESASIQLQLALDAETSDNGAEELHPDPPAPYEDARYDILVRYLGDITVEGALKRRLVPKELAAISFIALHRSVTIDRVEDALWASPTTDTRRDRLFHHMSACRNALVDEGNLPHAKDGYYTVSPNVGTDLDLFEARVGAASTEPRESVAVELLLGALRLCTGRVFDYQSRDRDSFSWVEGANLQSHWERRVTNLAHEVAERCLEQGDTLGAIEACEAGLRALPVDTACTEALMRAHATDGDLSAVRSVYHEHVVALERIHLDQPAESTTDLYEHLVARGD